MNQEIVKFVQGLCAICPDIQSIWLIGSRANGTETETSDWDFIAFGNETVLKNLATHPGFHRPNVDFFVVTDGDKFQAPWGDLNKGGYLSEWNWKETSCTTAKYTQAKSVEGKTVLAEKKAFKVWPL
jgi:hypothetical protein